MKLNPVFKASVAPVLAFLLAASCSPAKTKPAQSKPSTADSTAAASSTPDAALAAQNKALNAENGTAKAIVSMTADMKASKDSDQLTSALINVSAPDLVWSNQSEAQLRSEQASLKGLIIFKVLPATNDIAYFEKAHPVDGKTLVPSKLNVAEDGRVTGISVSAYNTSQDAGSEFVQGAPVKQVKAVIGLSGELRIPGDNDQIAAQVYYPIDERTIHELLARLR